MNDKYLQYEIEDFLTDDSFIAYAKNLDSSNVQYWKDILDEYPELKGIIEEAKRMVNSFQFEKNIPSDTQIDNIWGSIRQKTIENHNDTKLRNIYKIVISAAAAIILIFAITSIIDTGEKIMTARAETNSINLPDNSIVNLNVDSKITYKKATWKKKRLVKLSGEAFFKVQKGKIFVVETPKSFVEVLGTSFNVYDRDSSLDVKCFTGKVRVISKNMMDTILLTPGFAVFQTNGKKLKTYTFDTKEKSIWKDNILAFDNKSLKFVFAELERVFDIHIVAEKSILNRYFTGQIVLKSKRETLENVCWPMHLKYKIEGKTVYITK